MPTKQNKRGAERYRVLLPAQMTAPHAQGVMVRVVDISSAGCRFMTKASLNIQTSITMQFYKAVEHVDEETKQIHIKHVPCHNISCRIVRLFKSAEKNTNVYCAEFMGVILPEHGIHEILTDLETVRKDNRAAKINSAAVEKETYKE
jgi:hypothetical protein